MRWLQPFISALCLMALGSQATGPLGAPQEKPLVDDSTVNWAEACPDYAKYSKYPQYVSMRRYAEQTSADAP